MTPLQPIVSTLLTKRGWADPDARASGFDSPASTMVEAFPQVREVTGGRGPEGAKRAQRNRNELELG